MREIGINLGVKFNKEEISMADYIKELASLGFTCVFSGNREPEVLAKRAELLAKNGMHYETLHAPFRPINTIWYESEEGEVMYRQIKDCVDGCVVAGAGIVVVHLSSGVDAPPTTDLGRGRLIDLIDYAAGKGIKVAFENQRKIYNLAWVLEAFADADNVGFCWDVGHEYCFTPGREYMPLFGKKLICTHIQDNHGIYNTDEHLIPFDGTIPFDRIAEHIRKSGYQGSLMLELIPAKTNYYDNVSRTEYLEKAAAAVKRLRTMIDG